MNKMLALADGFLAGRETAAAGGHFKGLTAGTVDFV
jgi:hypothetical protein